MCAVCELACIASMREAPFPAFMALPGTLVAAASAARDAASLADRALFSVLASESEVVISVILVWRLSTLASTISHCFLKWIPSLTSSFWAANSALRVATSSSEAVGRQSLHFCLSAVPNNTHI